MIEIFDRASGQSLGTLTTTQIQYLMDQMEEESSEDQDYTVTTMLLDYLSEELAEQQAVIALLRQALGAREEMQIEWRGDIPEEAEESNIENILHEADSENTDKTG